MSSYSTGCNLWVNLEVKEGVVCITRAGIYIKNYAAKDAPKSVSLDILSIKGGGTAALFL